MTAFRCYLRVSSARQAKDGLSLDVQEERLRAAASRVDADVIVYREEGVSGRQASRPELDRMLAELESGDTVAVVALDRLGRSLTGVLATVSEIGERGAQLLSLRDNVDTSSPYGRFMFQVTGAFAELESGLIGERIRDVRAAAVKRHGRHFGGRRPFGREPDGSIRHSEAKVIRERIVAPFLAGIAMRQIARDLIDDEVATAGGGTWRSMTLTRMLERPHLAGLIEIDGELVPASLEPITDRETWERVQAILAGRRSGEARGRHPVAPYLLSGPLDARCGVCGGRIRPRTVHRKGRPTLYRYICTSKADRGVCSMSRIPRDDVDSLLVDLFAREVIDEKATLAAIENATKALIADTEGALREAKRQAKEATEAYTRVHRDYSTGRLTPEEWREHFEAWLTEERDAALAEVERTEHHLAELRDEDPLREAQDALLALMERIRGLTNGYRAGDEALVGQLRSALAQVVERVVIAPLDAPENEDETHDEGRSVFLVDKGRIIRIVARETWTPAQIVHLPDGPAHQEIPAIPLVSLETTKVPSPR